MMLFGWHRSVCVFSLNFEQIAHLQSDGMIDCVRFECKSTRISQTFRFELKWARVPNGHTRFVGFSVLCDCRLMSKRFYYFADEEIATDSRTHINQLGNCFCENAFITFRSTPCTANNRAVGCRLTATHIDVWYTNVLMCWLPSPFWLVSVIWFTFG